MQRLITILKMKPSLLLFAFVVATVGCTVVASYEYTVCVGSETDLEQNSLLPPGCYSLDDVPALVNDSTLIQFNTSELKLTTLVTFKRKKYVRIVGLDGNTTISCLSPNTSTGSGLAFIAVENLTLANLTFQNCGALHNSTTANCETGDSTVLFRSSIYILNCTDVNVINVSVRHSKGNGMAFFDTNGTVNVENSTFEWNRVPESEVLAYPGGGGVYVEFTYCTPGHYNCNWLSVHKHRLSSNITYTFRNCHFLHNNASTLKPEYGFVHATGTDFQGLGRGGGLCVFVKGMATNNTVNVSNCVFQENSAIWGGGLYVAFQDSPNYNTITIHNSTFESNGCYKFGGGGADIGYLSVFKENPPRNNSVTFQNCNFTNNTAKHGGGIEFYSSQVKEIYCNLTNTIVFLNCTWKQNKARYGSAVGISPHVWDTLSTGFLPVPVFENCTFVSNWVIYNYTYSEHWMQYQTGKGALLTSGFRIKFKGTLHFEDNNGTAMYITSSILEFAAGVNVTFMNNTGFNGGAVALMGFSSIQVNDNSEITFANNSAVHLGGAMYVFSINKHDYISSHSCFIQYIGSKPVNQVDERNITFYFIGNHISPQNNGCSIFATSMNPCHNYCSELSSGNLTIANAFDCIGNFTFENSSCENAPYEISTFGSDFTVNEADPIPLEVVPGKEFELPISIKDDFDHEVPAVYNVVVERPNNSTVDIDRGYSYISAKRVKLYGNPNDAGQLVLSEIGFGGVSLSLEVHIQQCPPGYILSNERCFDFDLPKCICAINSNFSYCGLHRCNDTLFQAYIYHGYWVGYDSNETEYGLLTAYCPAGFCFLEQEYTKHYLLPPNASRKSLDRLVCGHNRTGILCGECRNGSSAYYHSENLNCSNEDLCKFGWLLYVLSELLPLTAIFVIVMIFNISFTSGATNGFIFFAQAMDSLQITANGFIWFPDKIYMFTKAHRFIYRLFNFDFFSANALSFCLWEGATTLDVLAFKYVTVAYALLLVLVTIFIMNSCNVYRWCPSFKVSTVKSSVIHGLSAFLIMCYAQCTKVSFYILEHTDLMSRGHSYNRTVVFYQGRMEYFHKEHLPYAIPALFCLITIVAIPPILLLIYPVCYKILALLKLDESRYISRFIPLAKLKPLLDAFQSCFKDNCRFFAGLYFIYRFVLLTSSFASDLRQFYTVLEIQLIVILVLHSVAQPYKKPWHNALDTLIFGNLAIINGITLYNFTSGAYSHDQINTLISIQLVLIILPMIYMAGYLIAYFAPKIKTVVRRSKSPSKSPSSLDDNELPARLLRSNSSDSDMESSEYLSFQDQEIELQKYTS